MPGATMQIVGVGIFIVGVITIIYMSSNERLRPFQAVGFLLCFFGCWVLSGVITVEPNDVIVYQLCGKYVGSLKEPGMWYVMPWYQKHKMTIKL